MPSYSVIVCAHNEEHNIAALVSDVLGQRVPDGWNFTELLIVADGCTDRTVELVRAAQHEHPSIRLLELPHPNRGKSLAFNVGIVTLATDTVVMFDADVRLAHDDVTARLLGAVGEGGALVSGNDVPEPKPIASLGHAASVGRHLIKQELKRRLNYYDNVYTCVGRCMAMQRSFYDGLSIPNVPGEDNFRYFTARERGLRYTYAPDAVVFFKPADTLADYVHQHARFWHGVACFHGQFGSRADYGNPWLYARVLASLMVQHPLVMCSWGIAAVAGQALYGWQRYATKQVQTGVWEDVLSTK
jgi:biofilm PGA synthesis N-glycosyltransferase PgaC